MAKLFTHIPYAEYHVASPSGLSILVFYMAIVMTLWWWREPVASPKAYARTIAVGIASITLALWVWSPYAEPPDGEIRVSYLDVGQGDAILLQLPGPKIILVDGGAGFPRLDMGRAVIAPYLWNQGITHIDLMVVTHPQLDHMGGLPYVLSRFSVGEIWTNGESRDAEFYRHFTTEVTDERNQNGLQQQQVTRGDTQVPIGPCVIHILNPGTIYHSQNDYSIVFRLTCGSHSFLLTGDVERDAIHDLRRHPALNRARVLKVPHHGAAMSVDAAFLQQVNPEFAVVSVGKYNRYGHPSPEMLAIYRKLKIPLYRTDRDGAIIVQTMGQHLALPRTVDMYPRPLHWRSGMLQQELQNLRLLAPRLSFWSRPTV
jgi:competence protein ComEC